MNIISPSVFSFLFICFLSSPTISFHPSFLFSHVYSQFCLFISYFLSFFFFKYMVENRKVLNYYKGFYLYSQMNMNATAFLCPDIKYPCLTPVYKDIPGNKNKSKAFLIPKFFHILT